MRGRKNERKFLRGERVPRADQTLQSGGVALPRVSVETDVPCNLGSLRKSPTPPNFQKILTFQAPDNAFSSFLDKKIL